MQRVKANETDSEEHTTPSPISAFINSKYAWFALSAGWLFYVYEYFLRASPSVMTDQLMAHYSISAGTLGVLVSCYYLAYVPLQLPCGLFVDYLGPRKIVTLSACICVIGTLLMSTTDHLATARIGRFLTGAGSACAYLACMKIASIWFDRSKFALIAGISQMLGALGGMVANSPLAFIVNTHGWQSTLFYSGIFGIFVIIIAWFMIRDYPPDASPPQPTFKGNTLQDLKLIVRNSQNILVACYGLLTNLVINVFAELWGVPFLMARYDLTNDIASSGTTAVFIGFAIGCLLSALFADYFKSHVKVMSLSAFMILCGFSVVIWASVPFYLALIILFLTALFAGMQILYFTVATNNSPKTAAGTTIGFINTFVVLGGMLFQPILGKIIELFWDGSIKETGVPHYSLFAYQCSLSVLLISALAAFGITYFIHETYKAKKHDT